MHVMAKVPIVGVKNFLLNEVMRWKNAMRPMRSRGKYCFFMGVKYYMDYMAKLLFMGVEAQFKNRFSLAREMSVGNRHDRPCSRAGDCRYHLEFV